MIAFEGRGRIYVYGDLHKTKPWTGCLPEVDDILSSARGPS